MTQPHKHTILLVDDDVSNLRVLEDLLCDEYKILTSSNGLKTLHALQEDPNREPIHLIISDQRMPQITGAEFLNHTIPLYPYAKRILLTGYTDFEPLIELVNTGQLYKFILKPYDHNDVQTTVRRALDAYETERHNRELVEELRELNTNLETIVAERTHLLQNALQELGSVLEELKQTNATKDKFFSIVAHDLRNTLQTFTYSSEAIVDHIDTFTKQQIADLARNMNKMATQLHTLLENLLEWGKIQKGQLELHPEPCDLYELTRQSVELFEENAIQKSIHIYIDIPPQTHIIADKNMLKTVLRNVLHNAIKFTFPRGSIWISHQQNVHRTEIFVRDNGMGIESSQLADLLRMDRQITREGTAREKGTGLGLPLCRELLASGGGFLTLQSRPHEGTIVQLTIPNAPNASDFHVQS